MGCGGRGSALCLMDKVPSSSSSSSSHHLRRERKMSIIIIIIIMSVCLVPLVPLVSCSAETPDEENLNPEEWLRRFGYLSRSGLQMSGPLSAQILSRAVSDMQRVYGLAPTGRLDAATLAAMQRPRCALPDRTPEAGVGGVRTRRFALTAQRWDKERLSFSILYRRIPPSLGLNRTSDAIRRAFGVWSRVTPLSFQERPAGGAADILLLFASGFHGDMSPFDGEGGSLAHAFYPGPGMGGDTHFDADEPWTLDAQNQEGINLFLVAVHELGHALGLEHSENPAAIMAPFYQWSDAQNFSLHGDDIAGVQRMYGPPVASDAPPSSPPTHRDDIIIPTPPSSPSSPNPPDPTQTDPDPQAQPDPSLSPPLATPTSHLVSPLTTWTGPDPDPDPDPVTPAVRTDGPPSICDGDFDTVTLLRGEMFVFKGRWFWRVRRNRVLENYPMPISVFWNGLPDNINAAYERHDGKFVFFKGDRFWLFREADVLPGYPQPLHQYGRGIPVHRIDTAIWWEPNEFTYFFSGDRYWRYNEETRSADRDFPKPISRWGKIPASPRGAFLSDDGASTYIYKGSSYWRFDNRRTEADRGYPRSILKDFMGCVGVPDPDPDPETERNPGTEPVRPPRPTEPGRGPDRELRPGSTEDDPDQEVNVVVTVTDSESKVMTLVMVTAPLLLILCILVLVYTILRTLQNKEPPRALVHCKRSLQDWV